MSSVRSKNTGPEIAVRKIVHGMGFRYRLHRRGLPGTPDLVFPRLNKIIFVHGCFWHGHNCKAGRKKPKTNAEYWSAKIARNKARDGKARRALKSEGWDVMIVWECRLKKPDELKAALKSFLS